MGEGWRCQSFLICTVLTIAAAHAIDVKNETVSQNNRRGKALNISKKQCIDPSGQKGVCTFKWDCIRQNGTKIGTCMDGFIVGTCCYYSDDADPNLYSHNTLNNANSNDMPETSHKPYQNGFSKPMNSQKPTDIPPTIKPIKIKHITVATSSPSTSVTPQLITWSSISPTKISNHKRPVQIPAFLFSPGVAYPHFQNTWPVRIAYHGNHYPPNKPLNSYRPSIYNAYSTNGYNKASNKNDLHSGNFTIFGNTDKVNKSSTYVPTETTTISVPIAQWMSTKQTGNVFIPVASAINRLPITIYNQGFNVVSISPLTTQRPDFFTASVNLTESQINKINRTASTKQPSKKKPLLDYRKDCGVRALAPRARIVGGMSSYFGKWPWQILVKEAAWLGLYHKNKCGGVLISAKYAITAGHCQPGFLSSLVVLLGEYDLTMDLEVLKPEMRRVKRMVVHRHYNPQNFDNDIAVLELDPPVVFKPHISPICLPEKNEDFTGNMAYVTGWGKTIHGGSIPNLLQEVQVPIVSNKKCLEMFKAAGHIKVIKDNFLCAGYEMGGKDSCEGDSGGPLMVQRNNSQWVLAGTVSHGIRCADPNLPGVYMRMSTYRSWIDKIIGS